MWAWFDGVCSKFWIHSTVQYSSPPQVVFKMNPLHADQFNPVLSTTHQSPIIFPKNQRLLPKWKCRQEYNQEFFIYLSVPRHFTIPCAGKLALRKMTNIWKIKYGLLILSSYLFHIIFRKTVFTLLPWQQSLSEWGFSLVSMAALEVPLDTMSINQSRTTYLFLATMATTATDCHKIYADWILCKNK